MSLNHPLTLLCVLAALFIEGCTRASVSAPPAFDSVIEEQAATIPPEAMKIAFDYFRTHAGEIHNKNVITIIDFDKPSTDKRMHVIDVNTGDVEHFLVAHGKNSGENFATQFSNQPGSNMSSLGIYVTGKQIVSPKHGAAMLLHGMEPTNSNALRREIIFHGARYVSDDFIAKNGRLGRSLGCPAVEYGVVERLVEQLKDGSVMLIYKSPPAPADAQAEAHGSR